MATADKLTTIIANNTAIQGYVDNSLTAVAAKGVTVADSDKLEQLPGLIESIEQGSTSSGTSRFYLNKCVLTVDDGYQIERIPINAGDVIDLGEGADVAASTNWGSYYHAKSHPAMTFQGWTSSIDITNNTFVVPDDICTDYHVGAIYVTTDGLNHYIEFDYPTGFSHRSDSGNSVSETSNAKLTAIWLGDSVISINKAAFQYCRSLTSITIPNSVTSIGNNMFQYCSSLTSIIIPNSVTGIGDAMFQYCSSLASIIIPNSVTSIGDNMSSGCSSLASIIIPNSVTSIGNYMFNVCYSLVAMILTSAAPPTLTSTNAFSNCNCTFLVPVGSISAYESATNWSSFAGRFIENTEENRKLFGIW